MCDVNKKSYTGEIEVKSEKELYNTDNCETASSWATQKIQKNETISEIPTLRSGIKIGDKMMKTSPNVLSYLSNCQNNINELSE